MMLLLLRLVAGEKAWKRPQVYYYFLLGVYETVVWIQAFFSRESGSRTGIDWQLFETWGRTWQSRAYMVENVIMFLPLGVLLPLAERRCAKWWKMLLISMLLSMMIEGMVSVPCQLHHTGSASDSGHPGHILGIPTDLEHQLRDFPVFVFKGKLGVWI